MHVCMYACMHVCMYACMHVCMYACMHVCMYACMLDLPANRLDLGMGQVNSQNTQSDRPILSSRWKTGLVSKKWPQIPLVMTIFSLRGLISDQNLQRHQSGIPSENGLWDSSIKKYWVAHIITSIHPCKKWKKWVRVNRSTGYCSTRAACLPCQDSNDSNHTAHSPSDNHRAMGSGGECLVAGQAVDLQDGIGS